MTWLMLIQIFLLPIAAGIVAWFVSRFSLWLMLAGYWIAALWLKGMTLQALDSVGLALLLTTLVSQWGSPARDRWLKTALAISLLVLSWWQVKNFATSLSILDWGFTWLALAVALAMPRIVKQPDQMILAQPITLIWLVPLAQMAPVIAIAGSMKIGQLSATLVVTGLILWILGLFGRINPSRWSGWLAVPSVFTALLGYHYAETSAWALLIGFLPWLLLSWPKIIKLPAAVQWLALIVLGITVTSLGLWLEWPEESLY